MITCSQIKGGETYMSRHLSANDYYSEGESVVGYWRGNAARILGIENEVVTPQAFEALRNNRHPLSGEKLRPRDSIVKFHDVVISAPKCYSVAAQVGGDERLVKAFERVVEKAFKNLESYAESRVRSGALYNTEQTVRTGNGVAAVYHHDTSRQLQPQLHAHLVFSNHTWDAQAGGWRALQPRAMLEKSKTEIRRVVYRDLVREAEKLGYEIQWRGESFGFKGIDRSTEEVYSARSLQREAFKQRYAEVFGEAPSKKRIEYFIKDRKQDATRRFKQDYRAAFGKNPTEELVDNFVIDWRSDKMLNSTRSEVYSNQSSLGKSYVLEQVDTSVQQARLKSGNEPRRRRVDENEIGHRLSESANQKRPKQTYLRSREKTAANRHAIGKMEAIRRMKRGMLIIRALQGNPALLIAAQLSQSAKERERR